MNSPRVDLKPLFAVVTLAIGIGLVGVIDMMRPEKTPAAQPAPLDVRPNENTDPIAPMKLELSCYDPSILPVWSELKKENEFRDRLRLATGLLNCSDMIEVKMLDLNGDAENDFLVRGKGPLQCGATGNCNYWIFGIKDGRIRKLLTAIHEADAHEFGVDELQASRSRGYPDVLLTDLNGQLVDSFRTYRFNGKDYVQSKCMSEVPKLLREGAGSSKLIECDELERSLYEARNGLR